MTPGLRRIRSCIPQKQPPAKTARSVFVVISCPPYSAPKQAPAGLPSRSDTAESYHTCGPDRVRARRLSIALANSRRPPKTLLSKLKRVAAGQYCEFAPCLRLEDAVRPSAARVSDDPKHHRRLGSGIERKLLWLNSKAALERGGSPHSWLCRMGSLVPEPGSPDNGA